MLSYATLLTILPLIAIGLMILCVLKFNQSAGLKIVIGICSLLIALIGYIGNAAQWINILWVIGAVLWFINAAITLIVKLAKPDNQKGQKPPEGGGK